MATAILTIKAQQMTLVEELRNLVNLSHQEAWSLFDSVRMNPTLFGLSSRKTNKWKTPGEPAFVSALLDYTFTSALATLIESHLGPTGLSAGSPIASGVFIHQKPKVKFHKAYIELGDLLIVRQHFSPSYTNPEGRAVLLQAKASNTPTTGVLSGKELEQFDLYTNWNTPFIFPHGELGLPPNGADKWNFSRGGMPLVAQSGCYGIVSNLRHQTRAAPFPSNCAWAASQPVSVPGVTASVDGSSSSLAEGLHGMLLGTWGRPWSSSPTFDDHWSIFVHRALDAALGWTYPVQRLGATAARPLPRRRDVLTFANAFLARQVYDSLSATVPFGLRRAEEGTLSRLVRDRGRRLINGHWAVSIDGGPPVYSARQTGSDVPDGGPSVLYIATVGSEKLRVTGD